MKILHISDLHFGAHDERLLRNLLDIVKAEKPKPNLIIASGDQVDNPEGRLFREAKRYLNELEALCLPSEEGAPRLIVVPGNHDYHVQGIFRFATSRYYQWMYKRFFGQIPTNHYFQAEKVWVFGFDSASAGSFSNGEIRDAELIDFHSKYSALLDLYKDDFRYAFKIVVVHHHPLPVNWRPDWRQRWLTMINAGTLLGAILDRKVDLVLHGHEHIQARARLKSSLGGEGNWETVVVSLGATGKETAGSGRNWFNLIAIEPQAEVIVRSFDSHFAAFSEEPAEVYAIRSVESARLRSVERWKAQCGFHYDGIVSITEVTKCGDAFRTIECSGLKISDRTCARAAKHDVRIPQTAGYIDLLRTESQDLPGISAKLISEVPRPQSAAATILWGRELTADERVNYSYSWCSVNAFAMNDRQFNLKYGDADQSKLEYTHFPVVDPIERLTIVARFPAAFVPKSAPAIRVTKIGDSANSHSWERISLVELELTKKHALTYIRSTGVALLQVTQPQQDHCYGIQWVVPASDPLVLTEEIGRIQEIHSRMLATLTVSERQKFLVSTLGRLDEATRNGLWMETWRGALELSLLVFDSISRQIRVVAAALIDSVGITTLDCSRVTFPFGDGLAGIAFKMNQCSLYVRPDAAADDRVSPDYYRRLPDRLHHQVLLSIPVNGPSSPDYTYAVFCVGSHRQDCPLRSQDLNSISPRLKAFQDKLSQTLFDQFTTEFLVPPARPD